MVFPLLFALVANVFTLPNEFVSSNILWLLGGLATLGLALVIRDNSLDRDDEV